MEPRGFLRRLHSQLVHEPAAAFEILAEGAADAPDASVSGHELAVCAFVEWIGVDELARRPDGAGLVTVGDTSSDERREKLDVSLLELLAPIRTPVLVAILW